VREVAGATPTLRRGKRGDTYEKELKKRAHPEGGGRARQRKREAPVTPGSFVAHDSEPVKKSM